MIDELNDDLEQGANEEENLLEGLLGNVLDDPASQQPALPFKLEKRIARLDITKNSKEDHRTVMRYTKKELENQLKKDYLYMMGKKYMMIQPFTVMGDYPYKKKSSDSDILNDKNVDEDYVIAIGRLPKWRGTEEFRGKPYLLGELMYVRRGTYYVNGEVKELLPHFALIIKKKYKTIKKKRVRDLFDPLKQRLQQGKPFEVYKEFPKILERKKGYS